MTTPPQPPLATGPTSPQGSTTVVKLNTPQLDAGDKKVLCSAVCHCKNTPGTGKDGRSLKQVCVSNQLKGLDETLQHRSPYKPEISYDMTKSPPEPFMDKEVDTKSRDLWPGWTKTLWPKDPARPVPYKPGKGYVRRPDVVIVNDPTKPPTQDNIKKVVEVKFPPDEYGSQQREAYATIAGDERKLVTLSPDDCDCDKSEPDGPKVPVEDAGKVGAILALLYMIMTKRPPPRGLAY